jgi:hypothetical protein
VLVPQALAAGTDRHGSGGVSVKQITFHAISGPEPA